jgi:polyhydroxyalkanoate synthase
VTKPSTDKDPRPGRDPADVFKTLADYGARAQKIMLDALKANSARQDSFELPDPGVVAQVFSQAALRLWSDPAKLMERQAELMRDYARLWQVEARKLRGETVEPVIEPAKGDKRFSDQAWSDETAFSLIKQSYLLTSRWLQDTLHQAVEGEDPQQAQKVDFYSRQFVDALSPSNFLLTNPQALRATVESGGENLLKGMDHLLKDLERGKGRLSIRMTDETAFTLGGNVATTPGKVVYQNDLMQLIQYTPSTETVFQRPLLIVPPWINKFYILDLRPKNSFIKWAVDQGHTVFVISWVNPDETLANKHFEDYMREGPLAALDAIKQATGEAKVNIVGYCIGGTLTACTLSYLAAKRRKPIASATFLTTMVDFAEAGELKVFIDEQQLDLLDQHMKKKGYLEGRHMAQVFNMMRDNDLIWSFVVNHYLLGKEPFPFDLLYWNADSTRMPMMMHSFYLRNMYLENRVVEPGGITLAGTPIDLRKVAVPCYLLSTREDHIAPWTSTYKATQLYQGPTKFVLSASGHIAGVVNPPVANKYCYWTNPDLPADPEAWLSGAERHDGSWWTDWQAWVAPQSGKQVPARQPGSGALPVIEDAPGSYVRVRAGE